MPVASPRTRLLREVEVLSRLHTCLAIETLVSICKNEGAPEAARVQAAKTILDRGWGKAPQVVEVTTPVENMGNDELERAIAGRLAAAVKVAAGGENRPGANGSAGGAAEASSSVKSTRVVH